MFQRLYLEIESLCFFFCWLIWMQISVLLTYKAKWTYLRLKILYDNFVQILRNFLNVSTFLSRNRIVVLFFCWLIWMQISVLLTYKAKWTYLRLKILYDNVVQILRNFLNFSTFLSRNRIVVLFLLLTHLNADICPLDL